MWNEAHLLMFKKRKLHFRFFLPCPSKKIRRFCLRPLLPPFFLRGFFLWIPSFFEGHHLVYLTISTFKGTNGGIEVALSAEPTKSIILTVYQLRSKIYIFNSKFFTLSFPFFKTKKKTGFFPFSDPLFFCESSLFLSVKKGPFLYAPFFCPFVLVRFSSHSLMEGGL